MFSNFVTDIRYGHPHHGGYPAFAIIAILALALGIGANTAVLTVVSN